jgi:hypothetical protein
MSKRKRGVDDDITVLSKKMCKIKLLKRKREENAEANLRKKRRLTESEIISLVKNDVKEKPKEASKDELRYLLRRMCEMNLRLKARNKILQAQNETLRSRVDSPLALCDLKHIEVI